MSNRRAFITLLGGAAAAWPLAARAQQPAMPVIGFLSSGERGVLHQALAGFTDGLKETGYVEGQNVAIEYRFAEGHFDRFSALASDLVHRQVAVLVVTSNSGAIAAKQATTSIPVVFSVGDDPVKTGIVGSLNRPEGNVTGVYQFTAGLEAKRLGLLHELVPNAGTLAVLVHPEYSGVETQLRDVQEAAPRLGVQLIIVRANMESEFNPAFSAVVQRKAAALQVCASPFFNTKRRQLVLRAARHALPAIYEWREFAEAGGLMSYGTSLADAYRQAGVYAGRILKGAKPADLPIVQSTKFEFVINLSAAKALGIEVPPTLSARADEVIE
jgi:putative tryptophan/tyrosine transport system substrate-binding protein